VKKRILRLLLLLLTVLLLSGCGMRTVDQMYALPKRSDAYMELQTVIDSAMSGMEYSAPNSGDNQQTVQMADLNGDGKDEYLVFAKGSSEKPLHILIFRQDSSGKAKLMETIESSGSAFEQVFYVDMDDTPGKELVVGRLLSDQVLRSVSVYTFGKGYAEQLLMAGYSKFLTCDLDSDYVSELMVIQPGESNARRGIAMLYSYQDGTMERSREIQLSESSENIKRIMTGKLQDGKPAVFVASSVNENAIITDIFAMRGEHFTNVSFSFEAGTSVQTLRNYYVYADDVDGDDVIELPSPIVMRSIFGHRSSDRQYLIRWYALDSEGKETDKLYSFHNLANGWYLQLDSQWANRLTVSQQGNVHLFYIWDEQFQEAAPVFTVYALTGSDQDTQATEQNMFTLQRTEGVVYAAKLEMASGVYEITEEQLINSFRLIYQDWKTGEI